MQEMVNFIFSEYRRIDDKPFRQFSDDSMEKQQRACSRPCRCYTAEKEGSKGLKSAIHLALSSISNRQLHPRIVKLALGIFLTHDSEAQRLGVIAPSIKVHCSLAHGVPL